MARGTALPKLTMWIGVVGALLGAALSAAGPARAEWVPVRDRALLIAPGSPLDFSGFAPLVEAGRDGRVVAGPSGHLAFASRPEAPVRFLCASLAWSAVSGLYPDHATADLYAVQLRRHGYNLARFHYTDLILMTGRGRDFDYDPEQLDRFRYLLAALKRQGIYWVIDAMSSQEGGQGDASPDRWMETGDLKLAVHTDPAARRAWSGLVETLYGSVNPYTGLAPLRDPALALVVLVNENGVEFTAMQTFGRNRRAYPAELLPAFNRWLAAKYGGTAGLRDAWPDLGAAERVEAGTVAFPASWEERGPRMRDTQLFIRGLEDGTVRWMGAELRRLGYPGLFTTYNNRTHAAASFSRQALPVVAQNTYFDEVDSFDPGTTLTQNSSLDDALGYLRDVMGTRWLGRPFVLTEWGHLFPNRFRHEAGIAVPGYAALQGWDAICQHGPGAVDLGFDEPYPQKRMLLPYGVGLDPVARASETLAALLFRRGDADEASVTAAVPFGAAADMLGDGRDGLPAAVTDLGLLVRLGLQPVTGSEPAAAGPGPTVPASATAPAGVAEQVAQLRAAGALGPANRSDPDRGLYESQTGQLTLDVRARALSIVTPCTEAASLLATAEPRRLDAVTVEAASGPATVAVSALDGAPIRRSGRLLVVLATDAESTGMVFRDRDRRTVESFGRMPVLIERQVVRLVVAVADPTGWRLTSLHLDGSPGDVLPLRSEAAGLRLVLDNAAPSHGPTTFFLLERRP